MLPRRVPAPFPTNNPFVRPSPLRLAAAAPPLRPPVLWDVTIKFAADGERDQFSTTVAAASRDAALDAGHTALIAEYGGDLDNDYYKATARRVR